jgi:hypothetical protein
MHGWGRVGMGYGVLSGGWSSNGVCDMGPRDGIRNANGICYARGGGGCGWRLCVLWRTGLAGACRWWLVAGGWWLVAGGWYMAHGAQPLSVAAAGGGGGAGPARGRGRMGGPRARGAAWW